MSAPAIEAEGLVKTYPGDVLALNGLGFSVAEGTIFSLLGPNGAGKSTTVKILTTRRARTPAARAWWATMCWPRRAGCVWRSAWSPSARG